MISRWSRPRKPTRKPKPSARRRLRLVDQRGVVELELVERVAQRRIVRAVDRVETRVDHRLRVLVAAERLGGRPGVAGDGVADPGLADVLHAGDQVADLADAERARLLHLGRDDADLQQLVHGAGGHHLDPVAGLDPAVDDPDVGDHAAVDVVDRVEDHRAGRGRPRRRPAAGTAGRSRRAGAPTPTPVLPETRSTSSGSHADQLGQLLGILLGLRGRQVDLVEHRDDVQVVLHRQVQVGEGLRLDALRGVDQQDRALAGGEAAGDLVREVDVPRGVDHVEDGGVARLIALAHHPRHAHGLRLDRDAALALDVHPVEVLRAHLPRVDHPGDLQHPVGQRRLAVVDVGDDAEVADATGIGRSDHVHAGVERSRHVLPFLKIAGDDRRTADRLYRPTPPRARPTPGIDRPFTAGGHSGGSRNRADSFGRRRRISSSLSKSHRSPASGRVAGRSSVGGSSEPVACSIGLGRDRQHLLGLEDRTVLRRRPHRRDVGQRIGRAHRPRHRLAPVRDQPAPERVEALVGTPAVDQIGRRPQILACPRRPSPCRGAAPRRRSPPDRRWPARRPPAWPPRPGRRAGRRSPGR